MQASAAAALLSSGAVLGVDIGWSEARRSSAACLLSWDTAVVNLAISRFTAQPAERAAAIAALVGARRLHAAALDGPLRRDYDIIGRYRTCERLLTAAGLSRLIGKPGASSSPNGRRLNQAANDVARLLAARNCIEPSCYHARIGALAIAEAFPSAFLGVMLPRPFAAARGRRSDDYYVSLTADANISHGLTALLRLLLPGRSLAHSLAAVRNHDERAAVVCAATALCIAARRYTAVGDSDGYIILPPRARTEHEPGLQPWAWAVLAPHSLALITERG